MNKQAYLEEVYNSAFNDELEKIGGPISEAIGSVGWLPVPSVVGAIVGAGSEKLSKKQLKEQDKKTWSNVLLPGVGAYRASRRIKSS